MAVYTAMPLQRDRNYHREGSGESTVTVKLYAERHDTEAFSLWDPSVYSPDRYALIARLINREAPSPYFLSVASTNAGVDS